MLLTQQSHLREFDFVVSFFLFLCNWLNGVGFISDIGRISYGTDRVAKVAKMAIKTFFKRVLIFFATNASFLCKTTTVQT